MSLRQTYTVFAPLYDRIMGPTFAESRRKSLARLPPTGRVLIGGIGTGLDIPYLPDGPFYVGVDITPAMLRQVRTRTSEVALVEGSVERLPFADGAFDHAVLHLILAVAPNGRATLHEAARVVKAGGVLLIYDKFLRRGQKAPVRRLMAPLLGRIATHTDRVFEDLLAEVPSLGVVEDRPDRLRGYFRHITLKRLPD